MTGPVLGTSLGDSVWGSAGVVLLSWEAVDFGQRKPASTSHSQTSLAKNQAALTELDVASRRDAFLTVLAAVNRFARRAPTSSSQIFSDTVRTLVQNQLRPRRRSRPRPAIATAR